MTEHEHTFTPMHEASAAEWLARRDRGLSASEQDAYMEWLAADPGNAPALRHLERVWRLCDRMGELRPAPHARPDPDLLAPTRARPRWLMVAAGASAMAAVLLLSFTFSARDSHPEGSDTGIEIAAQSLPDHMRVISGMNGQQRLEDGSIIEVRSDTHLEIHFSESRRHVHLVRGEASFSVAHDASRPFVVEAAGITVRALGTVFSVGLDRFDVSVEVSEGSVEVREGAALEERVEDRSIVLAAGEKAVLRYKRLIPFDELPAYREKARPKD